MPTTSVGLNNWLSSCQKSKATTIRPNWTTIVAVITAVGHFGPNVIASWTHGKNTLNALLYHLLPSAALIGIGLGLIGLCQPPIRFSARVGLVGIAGAGLAFSCGA